jgi:hypothetical protein
MGTGGRCRQGLLPLTSWTQIGEAQNHGAVLEVSCRTHGGVLGPCGQEVGTSGLHNIILEWGSNTPATQP